MPQAIRPLRSCVPVTTSSLRFERGVWRSGQNDLLELIAGMLCAFHPQVRCSQPHVSIKKQWEAPTLTTSKKQVEKLTGCAFEASVLEEIITLMGATCQDNQYRWQVPDWRFDLSLEQNFIGEIVRCYGLDSLSDPSRQTPPRPRRAVLSRVAIDPWLNHGAQEVVTYSFVPQSWVNISGPDNCPPDSCYVIQNPISDELSVMRPSLFPSLCDRLAFHQRHQLDLVPLVELAPVYHPSWPQRQRLRLSVAWPEKNSQRYWGSGHKETTFYDIKGLIEGILPAQVSFITGQEVSGSERLYHPQLQATLMLGSQCVGSFGLLDPRAAQQHDWPSAWLIELDAEFCEQQRPTPQYQSFSKMPCVVRDWAFIIPEKTKSSDLLSRVQGYDWPLCRSVRVFDFYVDGAGQRSVGLEVRFQAPDRSLTDEDLQQLSAHIIDDLSTHFGAKIRE